MFGAVHVRGLSLILCIATEISLISAQYFPTHIGQLGSENAHRHLQADPANSCRTNTGCTPSIQCSGVYGTGQVCASDGSTGYADSSGLSYDTATGRFEGAVITNACNDHARFVQGQSVGGNNNLAFCQSQSIPAPNVPLDGASGIRTLGRIGVTLSGGVNIYSPFEAGFNDCATDPMPCACDGASCQSGLDVRTCEEHLFHACDTAVNTRLFMDSCGGHAYPYHIHTDPVCNYESDADTGHSSLLGVGLDGFGIYGKFESNSKRPCDLDACHGHVGPVPIDDEHGVTGVASVYHYHVQDNATYPGTWTLGCYGDPSHPLTVEECKALYPTCNDGDTVMITTDDFPHGVSVDPMCPCFKVPVPTECVVDDNDAEKVNFLIFQPDDMPFFWDFEPTAAPGQPSAPRSPTPHIDSLVTNGVTFSRAYTSSPMCAPSRFSLLTGRYPSRSKYAQGRTASRCESAEVLVTDVTVPNAKMDDAFDQAHNLPAALRAIGYRTGIVGKWHLSREGADPWGDYEAAVTAAQDAGFDFADGLYIGNMNPQRDGLAFSHNMEWVTAAALTFISEARNLSKSWYLYCNPTVPHSPDAAEALALDVRITPNGELPSAPDAGSMPSRSDLIARAAATGFGNNVIGSMWADDALGALLDHLRTNDELDKTLVLFTMDHGVGGKSSLYETGVRIAVFARLPSIFPPNTVSDKLLTNMDWAPTMYNLALSRSALSANEQPAQYWDGSDLLDEDLDLNLRTIAFEINQDRGLLLRGKYKYIKLDDDPADCTSNANADDDGNAADTRYPFSSDSEQLYDLTTSSNEQITSISDAELTKLVDEARRTLTCHLGATAATDARDFAECADLAVGTTSSPPPSSPLPVCEQILSYIDVQADGKWCNTVRKTASECLQSYATTYRGPVMNKMQLCRPSGDNCLMSEAEEDIIWCPKPRSAECDLLDTLTDVREDQEWCNTDPARRENKEDCEAAYVTTYRGPSKLGDIFEARSRCYHDQAASACLMEQRDVFCFI